MNERIKELALQAEDYADGNVDQGGEFHESYTQKLAELIIRECAQVASDYDGAHYVGDAIEQHFGVK